MNFIEAMKIAEGVFAQYKIDQLKWWKRLDGTPMLNDLAVRFSEAFMEAATEKQDSAKRCKVGSVCTPETCRCALICDEPNVCASNSSAQADVAAVRDAALEEAAMVCSDIARKYTEHRNRWTYEPLGLDASGCAYAIRALKSAAPTAQPQADGETHV